MTASIVASAHIASRWLRMDFDIAVARAREIAEVDAVYVWNDCGWALLVGADMRPLMANPGQPLELLVADFAAGWRTDYAEPGAA